MFEYLVQNSMITNATLVRPLLVRCLLQAAARLLIASTLGMAALTADAQTQSMTTQANSPADAANVAAWLQHISAQLRVLHADLLECRIDIVESTLPGIEKDVRRTRDEQNRVEEEQRQRKVDVVEIDGLLAQQDLAPEERQDLEARRLALLTKASNDPESTQPGLAERETQATQRLEQQRQQLDLLRARIRELMPERDSRSTSAETPSSRVR
jgi:hypothetical protein